MAENLTSPVPILFCITELDPGGAEHALVQLVTRINRNDWEPHVIALGEETELSQRLRDENIPVTCLNAISSKQFSIYPKLVKEFRRINPAIVQTYLFHANILGRFAARAARIKHVLSGIRVAEKRGKWYHRVDRWTDRWVSKHVCVSESVQNFAIKTTRLPKEKLIVIPNGVDVDRFANASQILKESLPNCDVMSNGSKNIIALFAGRLDQQKGVADLLQIAENLQKELPQLKWLVAGEGAMRSELDCLIVEKKLSQTVHLLGRRNDIASLMKTADLFVFPSRWEGMPNVILEAMAAKLPIVTSDVEGISELLIDQQSAFIIPQATSISPQGSPQGNIVAMSEAVKTLATNPTLRTSFANVAFENVSRNFRWEQTVKQYQQLYKKLLDTAAQTASLKR